MSDSAITSTNTVRSVKRVALIAGLVLAAAWLYWPKPVELSPALYEHVVKELSTRTAYRSVAIVTEAVESVDERTWNGVRCTFVRQYGVTRLSECESVHGLTSNNAMFHVDEYEKRD